MTTTLPGRATAARSAFAVVGAVAARPGLWPIAVRQAAALRADGSLLPGAAYLGFRLTTQYGDPHHRAEPDDVVSYLRWCRAWRAITRGARHGA